MGITKFSLNLIESVLISQKIETVCELGSQNLYDEDYGFKFPYASVFYEKAGINYTCIDLNGKNKAMKIDLEKEFCVEKQYDLITDFGTGEHVRNYYQLLRTIHKLSKPGGIIIRENPRKDHWAGHGFWYLLKEFYPVFSSMIGYNLLDYGESIAMGNTESGKNIYAVMKTPENSTAFPTREKFNSVLSNFIFDK